MSRPLSEADEEKDIAYADIVSVLDMDEDASRKAANYLANQVLIQISVQGAPISVERLGNIHLTLGSPSYILHITHEGIVEAERSLEA